MQYICKLVDVSLLCCNFCLYNISELDIIDSPTEIIVNYNLVADINSLSSDIIASPIKINLNYRRFVDDVLHMKFSYFLFNFHQVHWTSTVLFENFGWWIWPDDRPLPQQHFFHTKFVDYRKLSSGRIHQPKFSKITVSARCTQWKASKKLRKIYGAKYRRQTDDK